VWRRREAGLSFTGLFIIAQMPAFVWFGQAAAIPVHTFRHDANSG
jgi:hypothetical protein